MNQDTLITPAEAQRLSSLKNLATLVYALQALSFFFGVTLLIGVIINYVKRDDVKDTLIESHFRWQIRTFWFTVLWTIIGAITFLILIGYLVLLAAAVWLIYRVVKGWLYLNDGKPMYPVPGEGD